MLYIRFAFRYAWENDTLRHVKHFQRWYKDTRSGGSALDRELPWMTYDAIDFLGSICTPDSVVFEWGSGGSTLFLAKRCRHVTSVEHDAKWSGYLRERLETLGVDNVDYKEIPGEKIADWEARDYRNPDDFVSGDKGSVGLSFEQYVKAIDPFPEGSFDIVVVDGRVRNGCVSVSSACEEVATSWWTTTNGRPGGSTRASGYGRVGEAGFQGPIFFQHAFSRTSFSETVIFCNLPDCMCSTLPRFFKKR